MKEQDKGTVHKLIGQDGRVVYSTYSDTIANTIRALEIFGQGELEETNGVFGHQFTAKSERVEVALEQLLAIGAIELYLTDLRRKRD